MEARKKILPSGMYHLMTMETTSLREALAMKEPFTSLPPLLDTGVWLEEPSRIKENMTAGRVA